MECTSAGTQQLIEDNLELVRFIARQLHGRMPHLELDDLIQEGSIGLMAAAREFDPDRGASFRVYASFRVRGAILDSLRQEWRHPAFESMPENVPDAKPDLDQVAAARQLLDRLPRRERELVIQRYYEGHTQRAIGEVLSITKARVCQLEKSALRRMSDSALKPAA
jgi:RNA polymerase sigma factor (sigma-70 family)